MFYYVRMEDMVPENHLLRLIDKYIDLGFIRGKVKHLYSHTGRPSIDPEILLRILLIGYLYGITSERRLCEDVNMHLHTSLINHRCLMVLLRRIDPYYSFP
jgi:transposase